MALTPHAQAKFKRQLVVDALAGQINSAVIAETQMAAEPLRYRSKVTFVVQGVGERLRLGAYKRGTHSLLDLDGCVIEEAGLPRIAHYLRAALPRVTDGRRSDRVPGG